MRAYKNLSGDSGVTHYEIGEDYVEVKFKGASTIYIYTDAKAGKKHIDQMKILAAYGRGLGAYISQHPIVRDHYDKRE